MPGGATPQLSVTVHKKFGNLVKNAPGKRKWTKFGNEWVVIGGARYVALRALGKSPSGKNTSVYAPYSDRERAYQKQLVQHQQIQGAQHGSPRGISNMGDSPGAVHGSPRGIKQTGRGAVHPPKQPGGTSGPRRTPPKTTGGKGKGKTVRQNYGSLGRSIGNPNTGSMYDVGMADDLAGNQFDPQIHDLKALIARLPAQTAQNQADIGHWYGKVGDLNTQAGQRAQQEGNQLGAAQDNATQSLMAALGGGANAAGGVVGAQGADQSAMLRMMGGTANQYAADMSPFIQMEQAGAMKSQIAQDNNQGQDYQLQLSDLMGQRGQAKTDAIMKIMDANNALSQQRFGNRLSKLQAQSGIAQLMGDLRLQGAQIADTRAHTAAMGQQTSGSHQIFNDYNPMEREQILQSAVGMNADGKITRTRAQAMSALKGQGFDPQNPRIQDILRTYYRKF